MISEKWIHCAEYLEIQLQNFANYAKLNIIMRMQLEKITGGIGICKAYRETEYKRKRTVRLHAMNDAGLPMCA